MGTFLPTNPPDASAEGSCCGLGRMELGGRYVGHREGEERLWG